MPLIEAIDSATGAPGTIPIKSTGNALWTTPAGGVGAVSTSATFTPAASSHTAGDAVGAAAEFANAGPSGGSVFITSVSLKISSSSAQATAWRLWLYNATPPSAIADDAAWDFATADLAALLDYIDIPSTSVDLGTNQFVSAAVNKQFKLAANSTSLFGYLQNLTTLTTVAVAHTVTLNGMGV